MKLTSFGVELGVAVGGGNVGVTEGVCVFVGVIDGVCVLVGVTDGVVVTVDVGVGVTICGVTDGVGVGVG